MSHSSARVIASRLYADCEAAPGAGGPCAVVQTYLLMHAMGPNVAGVIGSAVAAGVMISLVGG